MRRRRHPRGSSLFAYLMRRHHNLVRDTRGCSKGGSVGVRVGGFLNFTIDRARAGVAGSDADEEVDSNGSGDGDRPREGGGMRPVLVENAAGGDC